MVNKVIVVLGSGPGIGVATASLFASKGFDVALLARHKVRLQQDTAQVQQAGLGVHVKAYSVDISDHVALSKTLDEVVTELGPPEVVFFNAARVRPAKLEDATPDYLLEDFKTMSLGLYVAATWSMQHLIAKAGRPDAHPSFLYTIGGLYNHPLADYFSLAMQKAAQFSFMGSLNQVLAPQGVHVGGVDVQGLVDDKQPVLNARNIAQSFWKLYGQDEKTWEFNIEMGNWDEFIRQMTGE
ncbi:hypothetical protein PV08_02510 [Exophiala spinifera]|uniref:Uncharacterized protein n=1 Tax=Exophiala spinifera TaxID=91928 RepID=A0A0D1ZZR0_9EURO|nr:uncharacterized protein PV08_02510 [Exophiala spinifera]KIW18222.1 hypothetical protein PV08_02510 [Exophiala spinifera]